jgi:hypothetical protein
LLLSPSSSDAFAQQLFCSDQLLPTPTGPGIEQVHEN